MNPGGSRGRHALGRRIGAATLVVAGLGTFGVATTAFAAQTLTVTPSTGLTNGQSVSVSGSGFTAGSSGNVLECNNAPGEPTVALPAPVSTSVSVGCSSISLTRLAAPKADGTVSTTFSVIMGTVGPPCGQSGDIPATCPSTDSKGNSPAADAALYPCPPTVAQINAGVTCTLAYGDQANESASAVITFQGQAAPTPTTVAPVTAAPVTPTTAPVAPATAALATTGVGPGLWVLLSFGAALMGLGALLWIATLGQWARRVSLLRARRDT